jgi:hypothetical protein
MYIFSKFFSVIAIAAVIISVFAGCLSYTVDSVEVSIDGNATTIDAGKLIQFNFLVSATGKDTSQAQRVKWSVSSTSDGRGPVTSGTTVSPNGTLAVSINEIYPVLFVRATHEAYSSKYDFKQIQVKGPKVGSVVLSIPMISAVAGGTLKVSAFVAGQAPNQGLTYSVGSRSDGTGSVVAGTRIEADGTLTVAAAETASSLFVKAVSNSDATKFDIKEIKIVTVTSVTVSAEGGSARVVRGGSLKFNAAVAGTNNPDGAVMWKVSSNAAGTGAVTAGTAIASNGTLTVAVAEAAATLYVIAVSTIDSTKSGSLAVTIPTVTSITISPVNPQIKRGEGATFTARIQGTGNPGQDVTWKLDGVGGSTSATVITSNGMIIISPAETLSQLIVTATSVDDPAKFGTTMIAIPAVPAAVVSAAPPGTAFTGYIITGSGTAFSAARGGAAVGTAGQPIQTVINDIKNNANGAACEIQFGDGATALEIGTTQIAVNNTGGTWGAITLSGKLNGNVSAANTGVIQVTNNVSITSKAEITNTAANGTAVYYNSTGTFTVTGGKISTTTGRALQNISTGTVSVSGGMIEASGAGGTALFNASAGAVNISGGTVLTNGNNGNAVFNNSRGTITISGGNIDAGTLGRAAVYNGSSGKINVSGAAVISSGNSTAAVGAVLLAKPVPDNNDLRFEMTGGTVRNTGTAATGNAIRNDSAGAIIISGGKVEAVNGYAINSTAGGAVNTNGASISGRVSF